MNAVKLGDICNFYNGGAWAQNEFTEAGYPVLKVSNCKSTGFEISDVSYIPYDIAQKSKINKLQIDDVIIATVGSHPNLVESAAGRSCVVTTAVAGFYLNQNAVCLRSKDPNVFSQKYLGYLAASAPFKHYIQSRGKGAANQMRIAISAIKDFSFVLPDIEVQKAVGTILSAYDDLIENNQKQIKLLEEAAQRLYKEWFVDLRFPGHETTPVVDGIPEGWERMVLSEVTSILKRGISPKYSDNGKYSVINQKCIRSSIMDISESRRQEKEYVTTLNLQDSDTVICSTGTGTLGRVGRVYGDYPNTTFDSHVTLVRAKENPNYIYHVVKSQQEYLMGMGRGSTNQQELYRDVIERLVVLCPSQDILLKAERVLNAIHCKIKAVYLQNNLLVESRDRLLPKLMSGEIEV